MKNSWNLLIFAAALILVQACGKKSNENKEEYAATETAVSAKLTPEERRAKIQKEKAERAEKRRIEFEERVKNSPTYTDADGNVIYYRAETQPQYTGGEEAMTKYIFENTVYPEQAQTDGVEGTVFVDFVVGADGTVRNVVTTDDGVDQSLRMEAIRVVSTMPKWVAGKQSGKTVPVWYSVPITFELK